MKKILWFIILIITGIFTVKAGTYYSEYGAYQLSHDYIEGTDTKEVNLIRYYNWYKKNRNLLDYELYDSSNTFDTADCYYTDLTAYSSFKPLEHESRFIESQDTYIYQIPNKVRYIHLTNLQGSYRSIRITELMVFINEIEIDYDYTCDGCWGEFDEHIHNGIWNENESYIANGGSLIIDLKKEYSITELNLVFYLFDMADTIKTYTIGFSINPQYVYAPKSYSLDFYVSTAAESKRLSHTIYDMDINQSLWTNRYITLDRLKNGYITEEIHTAYRYKELWCRKYLDEIIYSNIYSDIPVDDYDLKDEDDYLEYYKYRVRSKITIEDNIIINSKDQEIDEYIDTTDQYIIKGEINFEKNGHYPVTIETSYALIDRDVVVDILENDLSSFNDKINEVKNKFYLLKESFILDNINQEIDSFKKNIESLYELLDYLNLKEKEIYEYLKKCIEFNNEVNDLKTEYFSQEMDFNIADNLIKELVNEYDLKEQFLKEIKEKRFAVNKYINDYLTNISNIYYNKIKELENDQSLINESIKEVIDNEKAIKNFYEEEILKLKENNQELEDENKYLIDQLNNAREVSKEESFNSSNYLLRIGQNEESILILILLILLMIISLIIHKLRKKSSEKKN